MEDEKTFVDSEQFGMNLQEDDGMKDTVSKKEPKKIGAGTAAGIGVGAAVVGAGAAAIPFFAFAHQDDSGNVTEPAEATSENVTTNSEAAEATGGTMETASTSASEHVAVATDLTVATHVNDDMTFAEAFAAARAEVGPGGIFYYHGNAYGTYYESEWNNMSADDKADYWASVSHTNAGHPSGGGSNLVTHFTIDDIEDFSLAAALTVDANHNDIPDMLIDIDGDGVGDVLLVDVKMDKEGNVLSVGDAREGRFDYLGEEPDASDNAYVEPESDTIDDILSDLTGSSSDSADTMDMMASNMDYDYSADTSMDPDVFIDNNIDTTDLV